MSDKRNALISNYSHLLTQIMVLSTAGIAATIAFLQTNAGKNLDSTFTSFTLFSFTVSMAAGVMSLISLFNQGAQDRLDLKSQLLMWPFRICLIGFVLGITLFLLSAWKNLNNDHAETNQQVEFLTKTIILIPDANSFGSLTLPPRSKNAEEVVLHLPSSKNIRTCQ